MSVLAYHWNREEFPLFRNFTLYSEISEALRELQEKNEPLMKVDIIGRSAEGRELYLVTITGEKGMSRLEEFRAFMVQAVKAPDRALSILANGLDQKVPVFINASLHGNEITGTDGALMLIEKLLTEEKTPEVGEVLKNTIVLINVCANPDGRVKGIPGNNGIDLNRDYVTQSQPEIQAIVKNVAVRWFPSVMVDLHGYFGENNVTIDACTIPHNPNYEYDLVGTPGIEEAKAMAEEIGEALGLEVDIPALKLKEGWDDYAPVFTAQYFMYFGALSHTVEVKHPNQEGILTAMRAAWGALKYAAKNREQILKNQIEVFRRGVHGLTGEKKDLFPFAYLIPLKEEWQSSPLEGSHMIGHLLKNGIQVKRAVNSFSVGGKVYPAGTYIVPMRQGLRGLANTMLWSGEDLSKKVKAMYDVSVYSFPQMAGFDVYPVEQEFSVEWEEVILAPKLKGSFPGNEHNKGGVYVLPIHNNDAVKAANILLKEGFEVSQIKENFLRYQPGTFLIKGGSSLPDKLKELAEEFYVKIDAVDATDTINLLTKPIKMKKTAVVGENFGAYQAMQSMGFDVSFVEYINLNRGYDLADNGFEALVLGGTETGIWRDPFTDNLGIGYGVHLALVERGRQQLIKFLKAGHDFIGIGYAGAKLNELVEILDLGYAFTSDAATGFMPESVKADQSAENGLCLIDANPRDPLTYSFGAGEKVYAFGPVWYHNLPPEAKIAAAFGQGEFYQKGFWLNPDQAAGQPVIVYGTKEGRKIVLMGIDPAFRCYTPATYRLLANALYFLGAQFSRS
ncbi:MAG: M14 family zinc carboxypeptidase [Dehalobacterium sp.]